MLYIYIHFIVWPSNINKLSLLVSVVTTLCICKVTHIMIKCVKMTIS